MKSNLILLPLQPRNFPLSCSDKRVIAKELGYMPHTQLNNDKTQFIEWYSI